MIFLRFWLIFFVVVSLILAIRIRYGMKRIRMIVGQIPTGHRESEIKRIRNRGSEFKRIQTSDSFGSVDPDPEVLNEGKSRV